MRIRVVSIFCQKMPSGQHHRRRSKGTIAGDLFPIPDDASCTDLDALICNANPPRWLRTTKHWWYASEGGSWRITGWIEAFVSTPYRHTARWRFWWPMIVRGMVSMWVLLIHPPRTDATQTVRNARTLCEGQFRTVWRVMDGIQWRIKSSVGGCQKV